MKRKNIILTTLFPFLLLSCHNKELSKIESRTRLLIQQSTEKENCSISNDNCVFQNDSICIIDYTLINGDTKCPKEYIYYNSYKGEMVSVIDLSKESSLVSFADNAKNELENTQEGLKLKPESLIIFATMIQMISKGQKVVGK